MISDIVYCPKCGSPFQVALCRQCPQCGREADRKESWKRKAAHAGWRPPDDELPFPIKKPPITWWPDNAPEVPRKCDRMYGELSPDTL